MTRLEKIELAIKKGITCNPETGEVFGVKGNVITRCSKGGYIDINLTTSTLKAHQFIWYCVHKEVVDEIDHINRIRTDNRIINLRAVNRTQNAHNRSNDKGYSFHKRENAFRARITTNGKYIHLGTFKNEKDAENAYLEAKQKYHQI